MVRQGTPLVGRKDELARLRALWELAWRGRGQCVLLVGEAGIGKSRLVGEVRQEIGRQDVLWIESPNGEVAHELVVARILHESTRNPVIVVWEDLHSAEPSTLELSHLLSDRIADSRILVLATTLPEHALGRLRRLTATELALGRLSNEQIEQIAVQVAGEAIAAPVLAEIMANAHGVPRCVEELMKTPQGGKR
jgi:predicted ATPase